MSQPPKGSASPATPAPQPAKTPQSPPPSTEPTKNVAPQNPVPPPTLDLAPTNPLHASRDLGRQGIHLGRRGLPDRPTVRMTGEVKRPPAPSAPPPKKK